MNFFNKKFEAELRKTTTASVKRVTKKNSEENRILKKMNSLLLRKDIINLDNEKVDALRMLIFHLEDNKGMSAARLVQFLKI